MSNHQTHPSRLDADPDAEYPNQFIPPALREAILARDGHECQYCGCNPWETATGYAIDHVVPFLIGGPTAAYNLVLACEFCNLRKRATIWIPNNLEQITVRRPDWQTRVLTEGRSPDLDRTGATVRSRSVTANITPDEYVQVREHAAARAMTPSQYVRMALRAQLAQDGLKGTDT